MRTDPKPSHLSAIEDTKSAVPQSNTGGVHIVGLFDLLKP